MIKRFHGESCTNLTLKICFMLEHEVLLDLINGAVEAGNAGQPHAVCVSVSVR